MNGAALRERRHVRRRHDPVVDRDALVHEREVVLLEAELAVLVQDEVDRLAVVLDDELLEAARARALNTWSSANWTAPCSVIGWASAAPPAATSATANASIDRMPRQASFGFLLLGRLDARRVGTLWSGGRARLTAAPRACHASAVVDCVYTADRRRTHRTSTDDPHEAPRDRAIARTTAIGRALACLLLAIPTRRGGTDVQVVNVRAREAPPGARTAAIYLTVEIRGVVAIAWSPRAPARRGRDPRDAHGRGLMRMRAASDVPVPARGRVELAPGGLHLMLVDPAPPLKAGERVPVTLTFERAGAVEVQVAVEPLQGGAPHGPH